MKVHAAEATPEVFVGQVNYLSGYGIRVYEITGDQVTPTSKTLSDKSLWQVFKSQEINGNRYYNLGGNQWVEAKYLVNYIGKVFYVPGYSIRVYQIDGSKVTPTSKVLPDGSKWKVFKSSTVNGEKYYNLGGNQWVQSKYIGDNFIPSWDGKSSLTVNYEPNYGIAVYRQPSASARVVNHLPNASRWKIVGQRMVGAKKWYAVGNDQWVNGDYAVVGQIKDQVVLGVSYISQEAAGAPMGCEAASALEALHYKGNATSYNLRQFLNTMPIAKNGNPYQGFGGTPYQVVGGIYQSIFPSAFTPWVRKFGHASNLSGSNLDGIIGHLQAGNPVVTWVTLNYQPAQWGSYNWGKGVNNAHVVTVDGYNANSLHIVDPENGVYWISKAKFNTVFNYMKFAVAIY
ncbi:hypothetical protein KIMC2_05440 [Xylocopilactobacillus apis]|uniref:Peptidase C39-like domain-containing protein n=2 Tax=Xylocopilactobacillus apis TaxID=2932183 RepID=A0AAU9D593_9LACO|nr:hypothetical protein KIMC2_05440 [Xylocopilactobacillus apis]